MLAAFPCEHEAGVVLSNTLVCVVVTTEGGRFKFVGRAEFRAFKYNPHALHIVAPWGERLQRGVLVVPQLLSLVNYHHHEHQHFSCTYLHTWPPWPALAGDGEGLVPVGVSR
jgi:hypothetical protein